MKFTNLALMFILVTWFALPGEAQARDRFYLLAVSWQPAFCEQRSDRPECASQTPSRYDASHFSLHGLWPQPRNNIYCGGAAALEGIDRSGRWGSLPSLGLSAQLESRLSQVMPGTRSFLHRHEFVKHGSCFEGGKAENYYRDSLRLMSELNQSKARDLFAANIGKHLDIAEIRAAFDASFGARAGDRIRLKCKQDGNRTLIQEITIGLYGEVDEASSMARLMSQARPTQGGCKGGTIDPVGLQ